MKRFVLLMFTVLFIIFSAVSVFAADTNGVAFKTEDINCDKGRIFKVDVKAKSSEKISAVLLKFTYDRNIIEYLQSVPIRTVWLMLMITEVH